MSVRILHVITGLQRAAGTTVFCVELCDHLTHAGVECAIAVQALGQDICQPRHSVSVSEVTNGFEGIPFQPDIVHIHALWSPFLHRAMRWARSKKLPIIYSPHGMLTPWALNNKRLKKLTALALYQYWDLRLAEMFHVTAESELDDIRRLELKHPVVIAPLGVNLPSEVLPDRHNNPRIALFVSRIHPKKGLLNLIDAWAKLKKQSAVEHWKFIITGPDQDGHAGEVMERAMTAGVGHDFEMIGPVFGKQKDDLYAKANLFVLPSFSENFGVVVIEALAYGCPVITTKGTPWAELLGNATGVTGWQGGREMPREESPTYPAKLATPANPAIAANGRCGWWIDIGIEPLAEALREAMCLTDEERRAMGENGRRLVKNRYTWPAIADQMKSAYEWLLTGGEKPDCVRVP